MLGQLSRSEADVTHLLTAVGLVAELREAVLPLKAVFTRRIDPLVITEFRPFVPEFESVYTSVARQP
jgi:hypothetical protein